jgi:hypothetical protein
MLILLLLFNFCSKESLMKKIWLVIETVVVIWTLCLMTTAEAGEQKITGSFSGSLMTAQIDVDSDGMPGGLSMVRGKSNPGSITVQTIGESAARLSAVQVCPNSNMEFPLLMGHAVIHFDETGELLFAKASSGATCFDPNTGVFISKWKGVFFGGSGKLTNATGAFEVTSSGKVVVGDRAGHEFDYLTGEFSGTIMTP